MTRLAARERRLIALALLVALVAAVWLGAVRPLMSGFAERADQRATALEDYARNARMIRAYPRWRGVERGLARTSSAFELTSATPAMALDAARDRLARDLAEGGASVHAIRVQPAAPGAVRLRADFQIDLRQLMQVLRRVHDQAPSGLVDSVSIASDGAAAAGRSLALEVRLDVSYAYAAPL